ncbi:MAG: hypothetical protein ACOCU8_01200 [Patescibacteria group bacterium]
MKAIRLGSKILITLIRDRIFYPGRLVMDTASIMARCGVLLVLYWYVYQMNDGVINNTTFEVVAWSMFFYFTFSVFRLRDIARLIMQDVQSGNVEVLFSKPVSYLYYRMCWQVGLGLYSLIFISIIGTTLLALIVGLPETVFIGSFIPSFLTVVVLGTVLSLFLYSLVGLLAFWIEDVNPVHWIVDKFVMILGGSYLPIGLFPDFMYKVAVYSPFGATQFITHTVYEDWSTGWLFKVGLQLFWIIILALITFLVFIKAKEKVSVNGG